METIPFQLKLKLIWIKDSLALCIDQVSSDERYSLTPYYFWPRTDAWEQLNLELNSKIWLTKEEKIKLLKTTSDIMNYWLLYRDTRTVENFKNRFQDVDVLTFDIDS